MIQSGRKSRGPTETYSRFRNVPSVPLVSCLSHSSPLEQCSSQQLEEFDVTHGIVCELRSRFLAFQVKSCRASAMIFARKGWPSMSADNSKSGKPRESNFASLVHTKLSI